MWFVQYGGGDRGSSLRTILSFLISLQLKAGRLLPIWGVLGWCPMTFLSGRSMPLGATKLLMERRLRCQSLSRERACPSTNWRSSWSRWEAPLWSIGDWGVGTFLREGWHVLIEISWIGMCTFEVAFLKRVGKNIWSLKKIYLLVYTILYILYRDKSFWMGRSRSSFRWAEYCVVQINSSGQ